MLLTTDHEKWLANPDLHLKREWQQKLLNVTYRRKGSFGVLL